MDIKKILSELDELFNLGETDRVEGFLDKCLKEACEEKDFSSALTIANEQIGYFRSIGAYDKGLEAVEKAHRLIDLLDIKDSKAEGTTLINMATLYRAAKNYDLSKQCYDRALEINNNLGLDKAYETASLYNNKSLLHQECEEYDEAAKCLLDAIEIISNLDGNKIQEAVSYTNLGQVYIQAGNKDKAIACLDKSEEIFHATDDMDEHFAGLLNAKGYYYFLEKNYEMARKYLEDALYLVNATYGKTPTFYSINNTLTTVYKALGEKEYNSMLDICQEYYKRYGLKMINDKFHEYMDQIAVGLCGEGSECLGLEDDISLDHDCGPGFALYVSDEVYDAIGIELSKAYEELPKVFLGYIRQNTSYGNNRTGVCRIRDYYKRILGIDYLNDAKFDWESVDESLLATAVSGRVFVDPLGEFSRIRNSILEYYPDNIWKEKLSRELIYAAQTGQYNYGRCMARKDYVSALIALSEYMKSIMHVAFLLNKVYCPYYKWQHMLLHRQAVLPEIASILEAMADMPSQRDAWENYHYNQNPNPNDLIAQTIEIVAKLVTDKLNSMGLSNSRDPYLEVQGKEIINKI